MYARKPFATDSLFHGPGVVVGPSLSSPQVDPRAGDIATVWDFRYGIPNNNQGWELKNISLDQLARGLAST